MIIIIIVLIAIIALFLISFNNSKDENYSPILVRPINTNRQIAKHYYGDEIKLVNPNDYEKMLVNYIKKLCDKNIPKELLTTSLPYPCSFCDDKVIEYIKSKFPCNNFAILHEKIYTFTKWDTQKLSEMDQAKLYNENETKKHIITFALHDVLRHISNEIKAVVYYNKHKYHLTTMELVTPTKTPLLDTINSVPKYAGYTYFTSNVKPEVPKGLFN